MKRHIRQFIVCLMLCIGGINMLQAQQYTSMSGLIHVPSADMDPEGEARIGVHFLNKEFTPNSFTQRTEGKYNTTNHYLSITPFEWLELGYTCTLMKGIKDSNKPDDVGFYHKDRYFSIKVRPLKEAKWWPSIAIGSNDPITGEDATKNQYFCNYYIAATKHFDLKGSTLGIHTAYRKWKRDDNRKWDGIVGGVTLRPCFYKPLRVIAEYTGDDINIGADCLLWKHLLLQASLQNGKDFSGGICFQINLF